MSGHVQDRWYRPGRDGKPRPTARHGHFGRELPAFTWEATDRAAALRRALGLAA